MALISRLMTLTINIGRHQLAVFLNRKSGRPKKTTFKRLLEFIAQAKKKAQDGRSHSQPLSRALRFVFESKKIKKTLGSSLVILVLAAAFVAPAVSAFKNKANAKDEIVALTTAEKVAVTTQESVRLPLDSFKITQGYHFFHRALDLKGKTGAPVYPVMAGVVETIQSRHLGYGQYVIINHGSSYKSLYAHLSKILVKKGQKVDQETIIGLVGSTGFSSGSHLHLEIYEDNRLINPLTILK